MTPILLNEADVRAVLPMPDLIVAMERVLAEFSAGRVAQPVRTIVEVGPDRNFFGVMPAALDDPPALGTKLVTVYHKNHDRGLPSHLATILLFDHSTGALTAVLDGRFITEARTAAVSAVSVKRLARADAATLAVIGSGVQARSHIEAIRHVRQLREIRIWSPTAKHREALARDAGATAGCRVHATETAARALHGADIVVLVTASKTPVLDPDDIAPGTHICAVGACRPDQRELPAAVVARARVFVDSRAAAAKEAGDLILAMADGVIEPNHVAGELGDVLLDRLPGRQSYEDITIFKSLGMAVEDVAAASLAVERAQARGIGRPLA